MNSRLMDFFNKNNILSLSQYGFRDGRSTSDAVHDLAVYIVTNLDRKKKVLGIFLDLAKAFDTVSVPILIRKMECIGIRGLPLKLFENYLSERTQCVKMGEFVSNERLVTYGVPQGSVIGPTLFLIYINDLGSLTLPKGRIISFADDTALLFSADTWSEAYMCAQSGFNLVSEWLRNNVLTLNTEKTHYIEFTIIHKKTSHPFTPHAIIAHTCTNPHDTVCSCMHLHKADAVRYLGIIIDGSLRFNEHINTLCNRLRKLIFVFKTLRLVADETLKKSVYLALAQSLLTYCITTWGGAAQTTLLELERAQRAVLKVSLFLPFRFPTTLLYQKAKVLTVRQLFIRQTVLMQHSLLTYNPTLSRGKRHFNPVHPTPIRLTTMYSKRFFCHLGPYLYRKINRLLPIYELHKIKCKMKLNDWLQDLTYHDTEKLLAVLV